MRINHNIAALNTHRQLSSASNAQGKSMEKLSSGQNINRAGDDAAGLSISEKMRGQIRGLEQAATNAQDGISLIQTAEGALNETHDILQRMRELAVKASNDTATLDDRKEIQKEINELVDEVDRIADDTEFNTKKLINGDQSTNGLQFHIGANQNQEINLKISNMSSTHIGSVAGAGLSSTGSVNTNFDVNEAGDDLDVNFNIEDGDGNTLDVTLDQDFGSAANLAEFINNKISSDNNFKDKIEARVTSDNKLEFVKLDASATFTLNNELAGGGAGAVDIDAGLGFANGAAVTGGLTNVSSLKVTEANLNATTTDAAAALLTNSGVLTQAGANQAITVFDDAIKQVSTERSKLGAYQNRLEHSINNLNTSSENLTAAESRIRDVDMAKEMMEQTKNSILSQAAQAMLAQANQQPQGVLQLLR